MTNIVDAPVRVGDMLAGKYRVEKVLGVGAMGVVVAALHVDLYERRALKFMLPSMLGDTEGVERFLREARAAVRLKSHHVARIHDVGRLETGAPYIVMEYLEGSDLKSVLAARGALPVREAVTYMLQVCEAIAEAHATGIIHRDLKPANLFVTMGANGAPCIKVLDFGIAKIVSDQGPGGDLTRTTALLGTPLYMSPEQMRSTRNVDARTDVWALGAILYQMLAGRTPFSGTTLTEICASVMADQPNPLAVLRPDVSPALEAIVMYCLEKHPARRIATTKELSAALAPFAATGAAAAAPPAPHYYPASVPYAPPAALPIAPAPPHLGGAPAVVRVPSAPELGVVAPRPFPVTNASGAAESSIARASAWSQPDGPAPMRSSKGLLLVVGLGVPALIGIATLVRFVVSGSPPSPAASATIGAPPTQEAPSVAPPDATAAAVPETASTKPVPSVSAAPVPKASVVRVKPPPPPPPKETFTPPFDMPNEKKN